MRTLLAAVALMLVGCTALRPKMVDASVAKPSNVAVYFTVDTRQGDPLPGLTAEQFHIYEDDKFVSPFESKQTILNPEVAAEHDTLLLVDMSESVIESGQLAPLQEAINKFTARVGALQQTAVYAFDGRADIVPLHPFGAGPPKVNLAAFKSVDPSTNLYGAVQKAIGVLEKQLEHAQAPLRFGTLVVFTDGTDHAHRVDRQVVLDELNAVNFDVFVIGVGSEIDEKELGAFSKSGSALSKDLSSLGAQFDAIAKRIEGFSKRFYLLSYCSPARAGQHRLKIEPALADGRNGAIEYDFDATGFGPQCDPNRKPSFDIRHPRVASSATPVPPPPATKPVPTK